VHVCNTLVCQWDNFVTGLADPESYVKYMLPDKECYIRLRTLYDIADCLNLGNVIF
jgi:hypothetical protein